MLVHSPDSNNGCSWARRKPGDWNSIQVSHVGGRGQALGPFSAAFPGTIAAMNWIRIGTAGSQASPLTGCWPCTWWLCLLYHNQFTLHYGSVQSVRKCGVFTTPSSALVTCSLLAQCLDVRQYFIVVLM